MSAILFGSISTVADTSELQREAFNAAFAEHGLDWRWDRGTYLALLEMSGGQQRIAEFAASQGQSVDAAKIHASKSEIFRKRLAGSGLSPRAGVVDTVTRAKQAGLKVGLVTTTSRANIDALLAALAPELDAGQFDVIVDSSQVTEPKPDKAAYAFAMETLGEPAGACVAIEDNLGGVRAAHAASVTCVAFPNQNTTGHDFAEADRRVERLDLDELTGLGRP